MEALTSLVAMITSELSRDSTVDIQGDTDLLMSGLVDSVGLVRLLDWLSTTYEVEIDPGDVEFENFRTPANIISFLQEIT